MSASGSEIVSLNQFLSYESGKDISNFDPVKVPTIGQVKIFRAGIYDYKLPDDYTRLEYIESSGDGQYIDTGVKPNQDTRVVLKLHSSENIDECHVFGARNGYSSASFCMLVDSQLRWRTDYNTNQSTSLGGSNRSGYICIDKNKNFTSVNSINTSQTYSSFSINYPIYLLAINTAGSTTSFCGARIIQCDIYDNETLIRRLIPCKHDSSIGLYDLVNNIFYGNSGVGEFEAGPIYESRLPKNYNTKLPTDYQEIEYIQSDGTGQYIDTGYLIDPDNTAVIIDAEIYNGIKDKHIFGCRHSGTEKAFCMLVDANGRYRSDYSSSRINFSHLPKNERLQLVCNGSSSKVGNEFLGRSASNFVLSYPLYFFAINTAGTTASYAPIRIYSAQIYREGLLVKNYLPSINVNTNECGLYETVDGNFLVNAGSGNFTPGMKVNVATLPITLYQLKLAKKPVIQEPKYITLEYIGLTGTQFIDTGYYPNNNTRFVAKIYLEERQSDFTTAIFGGRTSANSSRFTDSFSLWIDGIFDVGFIYQHGTLTASKLYVPVYGDVNIDANKNRVTLNNQASVATIEQTFTSTETLRIASNYTTDRNYTDGSGNDTRRFEGKIYSASIYDNEILVRDFIPAKRISDSKIGLYDRTNDTFYENAGTGNFEAGPETGTI